MSEPKEPSKSDQVTLAHADWAAAVANATPGLPTSRPQIDPNIGRTLDGRYLIERRLGEGGMGVVYLGRHKVIDKRVAIKILRGEMSADDEMVGRFLNEARSASSIGNPHIIDISDFGRLEDGSTYFVMEFLDGPDLGDLVAENGAIPIPRLVHIAKQIARGLAATHKQEIVHRDLKPENVMLIQRGGDRDFVKVLDFGIAKVGGEAGSNTRTGSVFGTPYYMSPEQAAGTPVDHRTDIYSLGVILYEMASGKVPFDADNFMGILTQHMYKTPVPIRALVPQAQDVPPGLEAIVLKALSKNKEHRYQSMDELAEDLERVERGEVPAAVQEMMARSGGFNLPPDYFRNRSPGGPKMAPATAQQGPRSGPLKTVLLAGSTVAFLIIAGLVGWPLFAAPHPEASVPPPAALVAVSASAPQSTEAPGPLVRSVQIVTVPPDAIVFEGTQNRGVAPVTIAVPPDGTVTIRVEHAGYVSKEKVLDGAKPRENIALDPERNVIWTAPKPPSPRVAAPPKPPVVATPPKPTPAAPTGPCPGLQIRNAFTKQCE